MPNLNDVKKGDIVYLNASKPYQGYTGEHSVSSVRGEFIYVAGSFGRRYKFRKPNGACVGDGSSYFRLWASKEDLDAHELYLKKNEAVRHIFQDNRYNPSDEYKEAVSAIYDLLDQRGMIDHER